MSTADRPLKRSRSPRNDAIRNRAKLLEAAGEMLKSEPEKVTVPLVAERAGLSPATAYRYFSSREDLIRGYVHGTIVELRNFSHDCPKTGLALFEDVVTERIRLVRITGAATIQVRSRRGFLTRLRDQDEVMLTVRDIWERPLRAVMRHFRVDDAHFDHALFLYNLMFDPREILDLIDSGLAESDVAARLIPAYYGALRGWTGA
ncbi:TetR/AcrR family transcriptional regulator [Streptomyces rapamycinicus]|uniref:HTH tetR-type domain-containing protein n=2 Tax=Streptomyces rapamycinicus TaxID=1226757 RepID=A0A0A0N3I6_STRRN|nr:TetR/AcrR family transcriptional regulator [Streptomyces rapamycinicus]AGP52277.1 hypothetical protein M271_03230 [Streptomyces rapamycinicus NRRL 5491]MBB4779737.1 AcrR family transcriptional regulator [Streptomyces rapamycinicus]RLV75603.1 hypothetical protein D3C57_140295 [Streptomyces rapamycinicus NRRL 5491]UTP28469.1 TetR/AcrR family transcriptional regulator [Streptomyces rapamycinicus NRRL 5491]